MSNRPDLARLVSDPLAFLDEEDPDVRRLAVSALAGSINDATAERLTRVLHSDPEAAVRAEAAEVLGEHADSLDALLAARQDDARVVEAVVTALGRIGSTEPVEWLIQQATDGEDPLVREAAVAALGEIGDARAVAPLIGLTASGPPQVRRRAVVALTVFDGKDVEEAIRSAVGDRNPMVREAAEMVVGRPEEWQQVEIRRGDG